MKNSTLEKTGQILRDRYLFSLIEIYLSHFCRRADVEESSKLALWVRSTVQREAFALSMIRARIVNQVYSAGQISELINVSRQAVYQMIKDCTPEGWLFVHCDGEPIDPSVIGSCKGVLKYCANDVIYLHRIHEELDKILIRENRMKLYNDCIKFIKTRVDLDLADFKDDIWSH